MSFLTDLFEGKSGNLGKDLSKPFDDAGSDFSKQPAWAKDLEIAAPLVLGGIATGGFGLLGEGALGGGGLGSLFGGADAAAGAGLSAGEEATASGLGDWLGTTSFGSTLDATAGGASVAEDATIPAAATLTNASGITGGVTSAAPSAWPTALDLGAGTAGDVGATAGGAGAPLSLTGAATTAGGAATTAAPAAGSTGILSSIGAGLKTAAPFVGAAGLAGSLYEGYEQKQANAALNKQEQANVTNAANIASTAQTIAAPLINQGQTLTSYLASGTLPPQFQSQVDQAIATQRAGIIQGYASRGQPTDPTKNSALQQDLAAVDNSKATLMTALENQLSTAGTNMINTANTMLSQGLAATQLESEIPIQMSKLNEQLNKDMMTSISNFAAAMNGGKFSITSPTAGTP